MPSGYLPILLLLMIAVGLTAAILLTSYLFGPRKSDSIKLSPYESGVPPVGDARLRFSVKFYFIAIIFIIFDIEVVELSISLGGSFQKTAASGTIYIYRDGGFYRRTLHRLFVRMEKRWIGLGLSK